IPRPRNAFILFRCNFVHQRKLNPTENEDNNVSRMAGQLWSQMTLSEKQPWLRMAQKERERHALLHPNYKY
ncbi:high mobility group box domain-containing protein, partial [Pisolithus marmoratus]